MKVGEDTMDQYSMSIKVDDEELAKVLKDLTEAQEIIWDCYTRLKTLGVIEIKKNEAASQAEDGGNMERG